MKKSILSLSLGFFFIMGLQAQTYIDEDFNVSGSGLPSNWTSNPSGLWKTGIPDNIIPNAGLLLNASLNAPGHSSIAGLNGNSNANNSILSTPSFSIPPSETGVYATFDLSYLGVQYTKAPSFKESASFLYTTDGGATWNTIQTLAANQDNVWEKRAISLANLAGKSNIQLGLKYQNVDTVLLGMGIDNFKVSVIPSKDIELISVSPIQGEIDAYGAENESVTISGEVRNNGSSTITSYTVYYQNGNNPPDSVKQTVSISTFKIGTFDNISFTIPSTGAHNLKVWVKLNGDTIPSNDSAMAYVEGVTFMPTKRILFEEATGTWCGFCPRGSYNMRKFFEDHPIGTASQVAVHNNDPMEIPNYDSKLRSVLGSKGYPAIAVDRRIVNDPGNIEALYQQNKDNFGFADVEMKKPTFNNNQVSVSVEIKPATEINNAKLALIITEDGVTGSGRGWPQVNYYAGGRRGPMGGYENKPDPIEDEEYEFVARSITPSASGGKSGLPNTMNQGQKYTASLNATLSSSWEKSKISYIVALIGENGEILNSDNYIYKTGLTEMTDAVDNLNIYPNPSAEKTNVEIGLKEKVNVALTLRDVTGKVVYEENHGEMLKGTHKLPIDLSFFSNGFYFMNIKVGDAQVSKKIIVNK